jgi:hypothetical protein
MASTVTTSSYLSLRVGFDTEKTATGPFGASFATLGTPLIHNPIIIIFDNQSTVAVQVSVDGVNTWRTFPAGEALVLDLRANKGNAPSYTVDVQTQFYVMTTGGGGSGNFSISTLYAK